MAQPTRQQIRIQADRMKNQRAKHGNTATMLGEVLESLTDAVFGVEQAELVYVPGDPGDPLAIPPVEPTPATDTYRVTKSGIYPVDTTRGPVNILPPENPELADWFTIFDSRGSWGINPVRVDFTGDKLLTESRVYENRSKNNVLSWKYFGGDIGWAFAAPPQDGLSVTDTGETVLYFKNAAGELCSVSMTMLMRALAAANPATIGRLIQKL